MSRFMQVLGFLGPGRRLTARKRTWGFPKTGDPNIAPQIVGSLVSGDENKVPIFSETPTMELGFRANPPDR